MSEREHQFSDEGISPLGNIRVVSAGDPALDLGKMGDLGMAGYLRTRDPKWLKFRPGRENEATWYTLRPITRAALNRYVEGANANDRARYMCALAACLVRVENRVNHETGDTIPGPWEPVKVSDATSTLGTKIVDDSEIEAVAAADDHIEEMGHLAFSRGKLHPKERRGFGLPPGSDSRISAKFWAAVQEEKARQKTTKSDD